MLVFLCLSTMLLVGYGIKCLFKPHTISRALAWRRRWLNWIPRLIGLRSSLKGVVPDSKPVLYLCNHRSYLDPVVVSNYVEGIVISKSEVKRWPLIGLGAKASGVLFVTREDKKSRADVLSAMSDVLKRGYSVLNFPEGTTSRYPSLLELRPGSFIMAAENGIPIVPIVIEYPDPDNAWVGDDTFIRHFFEAFGKKRIWSCVVIGEPLRHSDPDELRKQTRRWMEQTLHRLHGQLFRPANNR